MIYFWYHRLTRGVAYYNYSRNQACHRVTCNFKGHKELNSIMCSETRRSRRYKKSLSNRLVTRVNKKLFQKNNKKIKIPKRIISKRN